MDAQVAAWDWEGVERGTEEAVSEEEQKTQEELAVTIQ